MPAAEDQDSLFVGLMSGTSMDGVDAAIVRFGDRSCDIVASKCFAYPKELRQSLLKAITHPDRTGVDVVCKLDHEVAVCFADATNTLLKIANTDSARITAIGSHGQTIRHQPDVESPFTLQIGDPNIIASRTGITTVADFRRRDMAEGGQGAPLAPAFHQWLFANEQAVVVNIGGIANVTILDSAADATIGFDMGPGNTLMDAWINQALGKPYDEAGAWAATGTINPALLDALTQDAYLALPAPKSTGVEYFNLDWLKQKMQLAELEHSADPADVQATLCEFTAKTICSAIDMHGSQSATILVCGGGAHNKILLDRIEANAGGANVATTAARGLDPDWVEAAAFAWLAHRTLNHRAGNLPSVTGARKAAILGGVFMN